MKNKISNQFRTALENYVKIKGIDIVVTLKDGCKVELTKNRNIEKDEVICFDNRDYVTRIPIANIDTVDLYAS